MKKIIVISLIAAFLMGGLNSAFARGNERNNTGRANISRSYNQGNRNYQPNVMSRQNFVAPRREGNYNPGYYNRGNYNPGYYNRGYSNRRAPAYGNYSRIPRAHANWYYMPRYYNRRNQYVFFPGYNTYYDPFQNVYIYNNGGNWVSVPTMPAFMAGINFGNVGVQFLARLPF